MGDGLVTAIIVIFGCLLLLFGGGCAVLVLSGPQDWGSVVQAILLLAVAGAGVAILVMAVRTPRA